MRRYLPLLIILALLSPAFVETGSAAPQGSAFYRLWTRDDAGLASGEEQGTWTWGPLVIRGGVEPYMQSPNGQREVWYLDKARMEVTHPEADPDDAWYVTSGLLVRELVSGEMQLGDGEHEVWQPAAVPVAGDVDADPQTTITYADLRPHASIGEGGRVEARPIGEQPIVDLIAPGGGVTEDEQLASYDVRVGGYDEVLGHNIADVFLEALPTSRLLYIAGRPLTEPYWARVPIAHEYRDVLLQAFERRVLTYTPSNPEDWRVEWGNVGRQYVQWRYGVVDDSGTFDPNAAANAGLNPRELRELSPGASSVALERQGLVGAAIMNAENGELFSFQGTLQFPMYSTAKVPIMLAVLDRAVREERRVTQWEQDQIKAMIRVSDNAAASRLLAYIGGGQALQRYLVKIGITNTEINGYAWGASRTTAQDMARLMTKLGNCTILVPRLCAYALEMMRSVVPSQKWGVSAGVPASATVAIKNGWFPQNDGWGINSIGFVSGDGRAYGIAVYTNPDPSMAYGVETIERISREIAAVYWP